MIRTGSKFLIGLAALNAVTLIAYLLFVERLAIGGVALSIVFAAVCGLFNFSPLFAIGRNAREVA